MFIDYKILIFFLFLHENIHCGYSLEVPHQGASNEYDMLFFYGEIRKLISGFTLLSGALSLMISIYDIAPFMISYTVLLLNLTAFSQTLILIPKHACRLFL